LVGSKTWTARTTKEDKARRKKEMEKKDSGLERDKIGSNSFQRLIWFPNNFQSLQILKF
jgi:hypothetical protein